MSDPWSAERYLKEAALFCELAENADAAVVRDYYKSIAQRYLMRAKNHARIAPSQTSFANRD
jgi:hypothetical protein